MNETWISTQQSPDFSINRVPAATPFPDKLLILISDIKSIHK